MIHVDEHAIRIDETIRPPSDDEVEERARQLLGAGSVDPFHAQADITPRAGAEQFARGSVPSTLVEVTDRRTVPTQKDVPLAEEPVRLIGRVDGREVGMRLLSQGTVVVGSAADCDLVIDHATVSRRHAELTLHPGGVRVRDLGSTNGTRYQGSVVREVVVRTGVVLVLGEAEVRIDGAKEPAPVRLGAVESVSPGMIDVLDRLLKAAATDATILIEGQTGTGKEVVARAIHDSGARARKPFEVVDCGALHAELAGAELFGHTKGAFTGADSDRTGAFERASFGTLFIDEVGELPATLQPLLLRALERREVRRIGEGAYRVVDVRIVAATNRDLAGEVAAGRYRADLWHRLAIVRVRLPPLRERLEDLPLLARSILDGLGPRARGVCLSPDTLAAMRNYPWPGNVRELRNFIERAMALSGDRPIDAQALGLAPPEASALEYRVARERALEAFEKDFVIFLLRSCDGNVSKAARNAKITRTYLHKLMKRHGVTSTDL